MIKLQSFKIQIKKRKVVDIFNNSETSMMINDERIMIFTKKQNVTVILSLISLTYLKGLVKGDG